ncbi:hypothetical protein Mapa_005310 [Marchantia paleacea]|nr:hypothetical protein Mapa_005310 [Marchantia paleacea]
MADELRKACHRVAPSHSGVTLLETTVRVLLLFLLDLPKFKSATWRYCRKSTFDVRCSGLS